MTTRRWFLVAALVSLALVGACRRQEPWPPSPSSMVLGEDACSECRMIIADDRFGAQLHDRSAPVALFDDVGCLRAFVVERSYALEGVFVRSFDTRGWISGEHAWVVESGELRSPMGYGVAAFADEASARREANRHRDARARSLSDFLVSTADAPSASPTSRPTSLAGEM